MMENITSGSYSPRFSGSYSPKIFRELLPERFQGATPWNFQGATTQTWKILLQGATPRDFQGATPWKFLGSYSPNMKNTRPRQFGSGACETLFKPPHNYFHQCSGEKIHCPHVSHLTFRILNMRFKCFSANLSCLILCFSAKSLSTSNTRPWPRASQGSQPPVTRSRARAVATHYFPVPDTPAPAQPPGLIIQPTSNLIISGESAVRVWPFCAEKWFKQI